MKYTMVRVKKAGGGHRMQRAMVLANGRYKFVSNKGHHKSKKARKSHMAKRRHRKSTAITHRRRTHRAPARRHHRRRGGRGGSMPLIPIALGAAGLAYLTGKSGPKQVVEMANKIPGAKTFGPLAVAGGACLAIDKLGIYRSKWLRIAGVVGVVAAAIKVGTEGSSFRWVGDDGDIGDYDLADVEDIGAEGDDGELGDDDLADADD